MCSALGVGCRRPSDVSMHTDSPSPTVGITRDRRGNLQPYTNGTIYKWTGISIYSSRPDRVLFEELLCYIGVASGHNYHALPDRVLDWCLSQGGWMAEQSGEDTTGVSH